MSKVYEAQSQPTSRERSNGGHVEPHVAPYRTPRLQRLGTWNVFTRQVSPDTVERQEGSGFFEFNLLGD